MKLPIRMAAIRTTRLTMPIMKQSAFIHIKIEGLKDITNALSAVYNFEIIQGGEVISTFDSAITLTFYT